MKLHRDMLKLSLWPTTNKGGFWSPTDKIIDKLYEIEEVEEVDSCGAGPLHIIVEFSSIEDMNEKLPEVENKILNIINRRSER